MFCHPVGPQCTIIFKGSRWAAHGTTEEQEKPEKKGAKLTRALKQLLHE